VRDDLWIDGGADDLGPARAKVAKAKRDWHHVGFPWAYLVDVCRRTEGRTALIVAMYIYRRTYVCRSRTVTLPAGELAELGINRRDKNKALAMLEAAGLIRIKKAAPGCSAKVTLTWKPK
jgi:hypothetical protein